MLCYISVWKTSCSWRKTAIYFSTLIPSYEKGGIKRNKVLTTAIIVCNYINVLIMPWLINFRDVLIIIKTILFAEQKSNWIVAMQINKNTTKEYIVIIYNCLYLCVQKRTRLLLIELTLYIITFNINCLFCTDRMMF